MMKILGTLLLVVAVLAPTQIVLASEFSSEERLEMNYQVRGKMAEVQQHMGECAVMINRMLKPGSKVPVVKMRKIKALLDEIDRLTLQLRALGGDG